jgi:hypothetical protein
MVSSYALGYRDGTKILLHGWHYQFTIWEVWRLKGATEEGRIIADSPYTPHRSTVS